MHLLHHAGIGKNFFGSNCVQNTKTSIYEILRMLFLNMDYNFAYFANFHFAHFEIEKSFGIDLGKITKWLI